MSDMRVALEHQGYFAFEKLAGDWLDTFSEPQKPGMTEIGFRFFTRILDANAAEVAVARLGTEDARVIGARPLEGLRVPVALPDAILTTRIYGCTIYRPCGRKTRLSEGKPTAEDVFLFSGDWEKVREMVEGKALEDVYEQFKNITAQFIEDQEAWIRLFPEEAHGALRRFLRLQTALWALKLRILLQWEPQDALIGLQDYLADSEAGMISR